MDSVTKFNLTRSSLKMYKFQIALQGMKFKTIGTEYFNTVKNLILTRINPANIYLFKVNNRNTRTRCEICSKLTIKTPERHQNFLCC